MRKILLYTREEITAPWNFHFVRHPLTPKYDLDYPFHWHGFYEFEIIVDGEATHYFNNKSYEISPGSAYLVTPSDFHSIKRKENSYFPFIYNFIFDEDALPKEYLALLPFIDSADCKFEGEEFKIINDELDFLEKASKMADGPLKTQLLKCSFIKIITLFLKKCGIAEINTDTSVTNSTFHKAVALIKFHFREELSLNTLAKMVGFSPNYLGQLFKKEYGISYNEYLNKMRLRYAKNLLKHSKYSIAEIAANSGFKTTSYFIHCFKERYSVTPKQYAEKHNN